MIRGLVLGEVTFRDLFAVMWKELRVSVVVGAALGLSIWRAFC